MTKVKKSWVGVAAAILLLGTLVGVVWARPRERPPGADITRKVTLSGGDFMAAREGCDWYTNGSHIASGSGACDFFAPVAFPCLPSVTVERIKLHVEDANSFATASAVLYRAQPSNAGYVALGGANSPAGSVPFQTFTSPPINQVVWPSQRAFLWLHIGGPDIDVHGVTVEYHRNI